MNFTSQFPYIFPIFQKCSLYKSAHNTGQHL